MDWFYQPFISFGVWLATVLGMVVLFSIMYLIT
jgi:hypothetical protein